HGDGEPVFHQVIAQPQHTGVDSRDLGNQHHPGTGALAVDVVGIAGTGERRRRPARKVRFGCGHCDVPSRYRLGSGGCDWVADASVRNWSVLPAPVIAIWVGPTGLASRVVHTGSPAVPPW